MSIAMCILAPLAVSAIWIGYGDVDTVPMTRVEANAVLASCGIVSVSSHEIVNQLTIVGDTGGSFLVVQLVRLR